MYELVRKARKILMINLIHFYIGKGPAAVRRFFLFFSEAETKMNEKIASIFLHIWKLFFFRIFFYEPSFSFVKFAQKILLANRT